VNMTAMITPPKAARRASRICQTNRVAIRMASTTRVYCATTLAGTPLLSPPGGVIVFSCNDFRICQQPVYRKIAIVCRYVPWRSCVPIAGTFPAPAGHLHKYKYIASYRCVSAAAGSLDGFVPRRRVVSISWRVCYIAAGSGTNGARLLSFLQFLLLL